MLGLSACATVQPYDTSRIDALNKEFHDGKINMEQEARGLLKESDLMYPGDPHARALSMYRIELSKQYDKQAIDYDGFLSRWSVAVADYTDKRESRLANLAAQKQKPGLQVQDLLMLQLINRPFNRGYCSTDNLGVSHCY